MTRRRLPNRRFSESFDFIAQGMKFTATFSRDADGEVREIFLRNHKESSMAAWGFEHKSVLTWAKPHYGLGMWFRGQTEHVLFGIRGKLRTRCTDISTLFEAPLSEHSEKPERFYEIVRAASYPPYGAGINASDASVLFSIARQFDLPFDVLQKSLMRNSDDSGQGPLAVALDIIAEWDR
jgi:hypothetical protein